MNQDQRTSTRTVRRWVASLANLVAQVPRPGAKAQRPREYVSGSHLEGKRLVGSLRRGSPARPRVSEHLASRALSSFKTGKA